jgi:hypothetical protein
MEGIKYLEQEPKYSGSYIAFPFFHLRFHLLQTHDQNVLAPVQAWRREDIIEQEEEVSSPVVPQDSPPAGADPIRGFASGRNRILTPLS